MEALHTDRTKHPLLVGEPLLPSGWHMVHAGAAPQGTHPPFPLAPNQQAECWRWNTCRQRMARWRTQVH